ncbi:hypothetical protein Tco_0838430 [Tanacetum coccineum]|uniref:Uncharacterized protein n=1 Tax=Tanacetum coccineum TaxID=301880 RepID=A0ABQ5ANN2_9ASTR
MILKLKQPFQELALMCHEWCLLEKKKMRSCGEDGKRIPGSLACIKADEKKLDDIFVLSETSLRRNYGNAPGVSILDDPDGLCGLLRCIKTRFWERTDAASGLSAEVYPGAKLCPRHVSLYVSNLKKCLAEPDVQVPLDRDRIDEKISAICQRTLLRSL